MLDKKMAMLLVMKKSLTEKELNSIHELLEEASRLYYNTSNKILSDGDFDYIYNRYIALGGKEIMGAEPEEEAGTVSSSHKYKTLVGSLDKCQNIGEFKEWLDKVYPNPDTNIVLYVTLKFDGNSVAIEYDKNGNVLKALTRGRDGKGVDLTKVFKDRAKINNTLGVDLGIKYEVIIKYSVLDEMNEKLGTNYKNPRSAISGKLGSNESHLFADYYQLEPLWVKPMDSELTRDEELEFIQEQFPNSFNGQYVYCLEGNREEVTQQLAELQEEVLGFREDLDFMIDGLVIDIPDKSKRDQLGFIEGGKNLKPRWSTALKFPYMEKESVVTGFDFTLGDSGKISPRVWFEPVFFNNAEMKKQYLQGYKRFMELGLAIGSKVLVQYRNDTLTYVERMNMEDKEHETPYPFATECPVCGGPVVINDNKTFAYCGNDLCEGKVVGRINNFFVKMDIKGVKTNIIQKLYDAGIWSKIEDVYTFDIHKASEVDGMGLPSVTKIMKAIEKKKYYDYEILACLGIPAFGIATAKDVVKQLSLDDIMALADTNPDALEGALTNVDGVADILAKAIVDGLEKNSELIHFLMDRGYKVLKDELDNFDDVLYKFVVTGDLYQYTSRDFLKEDLEKRGHKLIGSVSKNTDYLVTNEPDSGTVKNKKARELGKPIITEEQLIEMLKLEPR